ncbi:glycerophosphodiester phosphodiesterase family protein [Sneathiella glossodoripedis]|uniref:glycerophosphodiester phosphodiesterase family protein n=1 Tax=Sneathiella glossodoripedis TaxID=418853 RepID=UPI000470DFAB|nr:glycerophosphodiester phosphodiesterase family protein [Sneathiella glossodoripedis]
MFRKITVSLACLTFSIVQPHIAAASGFDSKNRPSEIINLLQDSPIKEKLKACLGQPLNKTDFSIGHRGAARGYPEHTLASYIAAAEQGAGIIECDVTFTKDKKLVCRHSQDDLHYTTNILATPLASKCSKPFESASSTGKATAECQTTDVTLAEFKSLRGKMEGANKQAQTVSDYLDGMPSWRQNLGAPEGEEVLSHRESIELFKNLDVKFTPELKKPAVSMPYDGFSQQDYAQKLIDEYKEAGVDPANVWPQSFQLEDILYWIKAEPEFGKQAVYLDGRYRSGINPNDPASFSPTMSELKEMGVNYIAPPLWMLVTTKNGKIVPSAYAEEAKKADLKLIAWTIERSGNMVNGGGWYYKSIKSVVQSDAAIYDLLHVLAKDVGVSGVFSDWPATTTFYANCMGY